MAERKVDHSALRTNQAFIIGLLVIAFVLDAKWLVAFVSAVMLIGTIFPKVALFKAVYWYILKPWRRSRGPMCAGTIPSRICLRRAWAAPFCWQRRWPFSPTLTVLGWALSWIVVALAALNLFAGICVGCLMYYWFNRLGLPGFKYARVEARVKK